MNGILVALLIVIVLLLAVLGFGLYLLLQKQSEMEYRLERADDSSRSSLDGLDRVITKMDQLNRQNAIAQTITQDLQDQMHSITQVMSNAKKRGSWGEYQLETLIRTYLGDSTRMYESQYHLGNGKIADGAFHLPDTDQVLCIDSKFPMENYLQMAAEPESAVYYEKEFRRNIKKHISDVADKYITPQTLSEAILFIPSEAVYQYLCSDGADLMSYAISRHVMLVSPTTLAGVVFSLIACTKNFYRAQNMEEIRRELGELEEQARRNEERAAKAARAAHSLAGQLDTLQSANGKLKRALEQCIGLDESAEDCF